MEIDVTQALKDTENALRDFISSVLTKKFGDDWTEKCGVTPERIKKWQERKLAEEKRQKFGVIDERLIYYADFYDLKTILKKHWSEFSEALGDWKTIEVWLDELGRLRDPDAHRRDLLPHQKHLAVGISGEIGTRLVRYRSKLETSEDYFPRIESVMDNYGNIWTYDSPGRRGLITNTVLRANDNIDIIIKARDPLGDDLTYFIEVTQGNMKTKYPSQNDESFSIIVSDQFVRKNITIRMFIKSPRKYHAYESYDDSIEFCYEVLPPRKK